MGQARRLRRHPLQPGEDLLACARALLATGAAEVALLEGSEGLVWSARAAGERRPGSASSDLIQGLYAEDAWRARGLLRGRIWGSRPLDAFSDGMVRVAAKRWSALPAAQEVTPRAAGRRVAPAVPRPEEGRLALAGAPAGSDEAGWLATLRGALPPIAAGQRRWQRDRPVAAALVLPPGRLWGAARNTNAGDPLRHAELNLLLGWWEQERQALPQGSRLFVTLQPCAMCAGLVAALAGGEGVVEVVYGEVDPGPAARSTALSDGGALRARFGVADGVRQRLAACSAGPGRLGTEQEAR